MREIIRTNDDVLLGFARALLRDAGIDATIADEHMSILEGSIGVLPRRLMVPDGEWQRARSLLVDADLGQWVKSDG